MPDWKAMVRGRLGGMSLDPAQREEIVSELAGHMEDLYEEHRAQGLCKSAAMERSLEQVSDWNRLGEMIQRAKREEKMMNNRTRTVWVPGLVSLTAAMACLTISTLAGVQPQLVARGLASEVVYLPWLLTLPLCGAAGAYLSRRAGGERTARVVAGLFPVISLALLVGFLTLIGKFVFAKPEWLYFLVTAMLGGILPAAALGLGAMPFLKGSRLRES